ncbi:MAG TPA: nucleotidyltransferase family protein [Pyrinomonadaceae bacterium]
MSARSNASTGRLIAHVLAGAWRETPPALDLSEAALNRVAEKLLVSRAGALAWWRLRHTALRSSAAAQELYDADRLFTLKAALHERDVERVFSLLRARGVEPILIKGWVIARFYPETALRPYGDIDLCVSRTDFARAQELLKSIVVPGALDIDLVPDERGRLGNRRREEF